MPVLQFKKKTIEWFNISRGTVSKMTLPFNNKDNQL